MSEARAGTGLFSRLIVGLSWLLGVCAILGLSGCTDVTYVHPRPNCLVPQLGRGTTGATLRQAQRLLAVANCRLGAVLRPKPGSLHDRPGLFVIRQRPAPGTVLEFGGRVSLRLANCVIPRLVGQTLDAARSALATAGCQLGRVTRPDAREIDLTVAFQYPAAGTTVRDRTRVGVGLVGVIPAVAVHGHHKNICSHGLGGALIGFFTLGLACLLDG